MYTVNMIAWELCGKRVKTAQGLSGHYRFVHQLEHRVPASERRLAHTGGATVEQLEEA